MRTVSHLEGVSLDEDDNLKGGARPEGVVMRHLLPAPALLLQRVADDAGRPAEPGVEVERHVGPWLDAAATGQVHLKPGRQEEPLGQVLRLSLKLDSCRSPVSIRRDTSLDHKHLPRAESTQDGPSKRECLWGGQNDVLTADKCSLSNTCCSNQISQDF